MLAGQFLTICIKRGGFPIDLSILLRITVPSVAAILLAPLLYLLLCRLVPLAADDTQAGGMPKGPAH